MTTHIVVTRIISRRTNTRATWNLTGIAEDVGAARVGMQLANSRDWPNYRATSEFRPIRDKSAATRK